MKIKAEDIDVSYEEAMRIAPPNLRKKIQHSVELIRKAEKIALMYDSDNGYFNTFSGGKDSQALFHIVKMSGVKFKTYMSLTSVDPGDVIRFVKTEYPSVIRQKPKMSIFQKAVEMGILPTMRVRWCCAEFKESAGAGKVTLIGIRKEESARRAKRHEVEVSSKKFSGNLDEFEQWSVEEIGRKQKRKSKRKINEDEFSVNTDNEVRCINGKDSILISPIFDWTEKDVWYFLNNIIKAPHCKLYDEGYTRLGCILCPMSQPKQKRMEMQRFPHVKRNWIEAIKKIRRGGGFKEGFIWWNIPADWGQRTMQRGKRFRAKQMGKQVWNGVLQYGKMDSHPQARDCYGAIGFSESPISSGVGIGQWSEDEIAEAIFDWWISGKPYKQWYADKYLQQKINFEQDENQQSI